MRYTQLEMQLEELQDENEFMALKEAANDDETALEIYYNGNYQYWDGDDMASVAEEYVADKYPSDDFVQTYINYDELATDLFSDNYYMTDYGMVRIDW